MGLFNALLAAAKLLDYDDVHRFPVNSNYYLISQNSQKASVFGNMARQGHQIAWVFCASNRSYSTLVLDGVTYSLYVCDGNLYGHIQGTPTSQDLLLMEVGK